MYEEGVFLSLEYPAAAPAPAAQPPAPYGAVEPEQFQQKYEAVLRPRLRKNKEMEDHGDPVVAGNALTRLAASIGAESFSLLACGPVAGALHPAPLLDCQFPGTSVLSRRLLSNDGSALAQMALESALPLIWSTQDTPACKKLRWARRIAAPAGLAAQGLLLPIQSECGRTGIAAFDGEKLKLGQQTLNQLHWECFSIFANIAPAHAGPSANIPAMSKREMQCLQLTAAGLTSEEIAQSLGLSVHTANQYLTNTSQKLNAMNRIHAVAKALRMGLID